MSITYQQTSDKEIHDRVRSKRRIDVTELKRLNFEEFCFFSETIQALGFSPFGVAGFLGMLIALFKEVAKIEGNLSVSIFNMIMVSREYATYAGPFGLGVKFYTGFTDGTCVISANFESHEINDDGEKLYKSARPRTVEAACRDHQEWVDKLSSEGKQKNEHLSFAGYLKLVRQEDSYMLKSKNPVMAADLFSIILSTIILASLVIGLTYTLLLFAALIQNLYPACLVASEGISLSRSFLIALACVIVSWILARVQKSMFIINGVGTMLFGHSPSPDSQGYTSTKWLTFFFIPILPVRSYLVAGEHSGSQDKQSFSMEPLKQLDWTQIRETLWQSKLGYAVTIIILIGSGTLPVWKCI